MEGPVRRQLGGLRAGGAVLPLDEALEARDLLHVNDATVRIDCSRLTAQERADRLTGGYDGYLVRINEERWGYNREACRFEPRPDAV